MGLFSNKTPDVVPSSAPIKFRYLDPPKGYQEKQELSNEAKKLSKKIVKTATKDLRKSMKTVTKKKKSTSR